MAAPTLYSSNGLAVPRQKMNITYLTSCCLCHWKNNVLCVHCCSMQRVWTINISWFSRFLKPNVSATWQDADESSSALGSLHSRSSGRRLPAGTTHRQFPTVGRGSLMSARDDRDSGYVGSTSSHQATLSQRSLWARTSGTTAAQATMPSRCDEWRPMSECKCRPSLSQFS